MGQKPMTIFLLADIPLFQRRITNKESHGRSLRVQARLGVDRYDLNPGGFFKAEH